MVDWKKEAGLSSAAEDWLNLFAAIPRWVWLVLVTTLIVLLVAF